MSVTLASCTRTASAGAPNRSSPTTKMPLRVALHLPHFQDHQGGVGRLQRTHSSKDADGHDSPHPRPGYNSPQSATSAPGRAMLPVDVPGNDGGLFGIFLFRHVFVGWVPPAIRCGVRCDRSVPHLHDRGPPSLHSEAAHV
jgi:hypothetical protein